MKDWMYMHRKGSLRIEIRGCSRERFLNLCKAHEICLWNIKKMDEQCLQADILLPDFWNIRPIAKKSSSRIRIIKRIGLPFFFQMYAMRWPVLGAFLLSILVLCLLSGRIWSITIRGNERITEGDIKYYLEKSGIQCAMRKNQLDCRKTADQIREAYEDFSWVSVRLEGTELTIEVKESIPQIKKSDAQAEKPSDIIADRDGVITKMITRCGTPCVEKGDYVKKGELLVKGEVAYLNDEKETTAVKYCHADADVFLKSKYHYKEVIHGTKKYRVYSGRQYRKVQITVGGWPFRLPFRNRKFEEWSSYASYTCPSLLRWLNLPAIMKTTYIREYKTILKNQEKKDMKEKAEANLCKFITKIKQKGVQIFQNDVRIDVDINSCVASGTLTLVSEAGRNVERIPTE